MSESPITPDRSAKTASNPRGRWRRWVVRVVIVLLLATVGNVGFVVVRWYMWEQNGWAWDEIRPFKVEPDEVGNSPYWYSPGGFGVTSLSWCARHDPDSRANTGFDGEFLVPIERPRSALPAWTRARREPEFVLTRGPDDYGWPQCVEHAFGWPLRCLHSQETYYEVTEHAGGGLRRDIRRHRIELGTSGWNSARDEWGPRPSVLPTHILWPGMLANTLVWSAIVLTPWVMWRGLVIVRARRRIARGRCGQCGYDRRGIEAGAPCPECGRRIVR